MIEQEPKGIKLPPVIGPGTGPVTLGTKYPKEERPLSIVAQEKANLESMPTRKKNPAVES